MTTHNKDSDKNQQSNRGLRKWTKSANTKLPAKVVKPPMKRGLRTSSVLKKPGKLGTRVENPQEMNVNL